MKSGTAWLRCTVGVAMACVVSGGLVGCSGSGASDFGQVKHTSHLWKTDRTASLDLNEQRLQQRYQEGRIDSTSSVAFNGVEGLYDVMLELVSDGTYRLHMNLEGTLLESDGGWRHHTTTSGTRVRLNPSADSSASELLRANLRSWSIHIDESGTRAVILSLGEYETVLSRVD